MPQTLSTFPNELIHHIASSITERKVLASLIRTCRHFATLLTPTLHKLALQDVHNKNAMFWAVDHGDLPLIKLLLENGHEINVCDESFQTPLHIATLGSNNAVITFLIENGADVNATNYVSNTSLHNAVSGGNIPAVKMLLERGAKPNRICMGWTPLQLGLRGDSEPNLEIIKLLLDHGGDVTIGNVRRRRRSERFGEAQGEEMNLLLKAGWDGKGSQLGSPMLFENRE